MLEKNKYEPFKGDKSKIYRIKRAHTPYTMF